MKEIDFLPEWYKDSRRREFSYRTQYIALAGIFVVMVVWNFTTAYSISKAKAELVQMSASKAEAERTSVKLDSIKSKVASLQKKVESVEKIESKIDFASVLAEMSFLIDERIVLSKVQFIAEKFADEQQAKPNVVSAVRVAGIKIGDKGALPVGDVRFKVVMGGVAADASDVAALVCKLEDSPYFCNVILLYSRDKQVRRETNPAVRPQISEKGVSEPQENFLVSEFEISCYLANCHEK
jgi:hypothetical protein